MKLIFQVAIRLFLFFFNQMLKRLSSKTQILFKNIYRQDELLTFKANVEKICDLAVFECGMVVHAR